MNPLVSVIVPCYNQAQYLEECLQSVLDQTYSNWECIVINDGSPDHTEEVAKRWLEKDKRFVYFSNENQGLVKSRNFAIAKARGEYILPLDSDNQLINDFVESAVHVFLKNNEIGVVYGDALFLELRKDIGKFHSMILRKC